MNLTYEQARDFLAEAGKKGSILGLSTMEQLMETLHFSYELPVIHLAGTNGKGSVGAYLQSILLEAGYRVGRYTSPAVFEELEVFRINGRNITREDYARMMSQVKNACDILVSKGGPSPTAFEIETALAFLYFAEEKVDVVLLETGMGGATDATNVIPNPLACVITTISRDHMQFLGESIEEIAQVKAGIIKPGCRVFSAWQQERVEAVLRAVARKQRASISFVDKEALCRISQRPGQLRFSYKDHTYETSMAGSYQMDNAALAMDVAEWFLTEHGLKNEQVHELLQKAVAATTWPGRFEVVRENPLWILDGAHNEDAAVRLFDTLQNCFTNTRITLIIGVLADKEHGRMLEILAPLAEEILTVTPDNPRALDGESLKKEAMEYHRNVIFCESLEEAIEKCRLKETVVACGSLSYLGDLKRKLEQAWIEKR